MDIIFDIETAPLEFGQRMIKDEETGEEIDIGALSPITGRITAIGWKSSEQQYIFSDLDEKKMLDQFWRSMEEAVGQRGFIRLVGFSIRKFDIHFLLVRSLHHHVKIARANLRQAIDLREHLTNFDSYKKKGKLEDYAKLIGVGGKYKNIQNEEIPLLWKEGKIEDLKEYLKHDLRITEQLYLKCKELGIVGDYS